MSPQELDYAVLRKRLLDDGQVLEYGVERPSVPAEKLAGVVMDDKDAQVKGPWSSNNVCSKFVDSDYLHDDNADKDGKSVSFPFKGLKPGRYECRISYPPHANRATNVPVTAKSSKGEIQIEVNQKSAPEIDALFTKIGELEVGEDGELTVTVDAKGSNGYVTVDAAQLIPMEEARDAPHAVGGEPPPMAADAAPLTPQRGKQYQRCGKAARRQSAAGGKPPPLGADRANPNAATPKRTRNAQPRPKGVSRRRRRRTPRP